MRILSTAVKKIRVKGIRGTNCCSKELICAICMAVSVVV